MTAGERDREVAAGLAARLVAQRSRDALIYGIAEAIAAERERVLAPIRALAEEWRYKGEFGWGSWQEGEGPDQEGYILDSCSSALRASLPPITQAAASAASPADQPEGSR